MREDLSMLFLSGQGLHVNHFYLKINRAEFIQSPIKRPEWPVAGAPVEEMPSVKFGHDHNKILHNGSVYVWISTNPTSVLTSF